MISPPQRLYSPQQPIIIMIVSKGRRVATRSLRVALRSQPVDAAGSLQPFVDVGFALEALDISGFGSRIFSEDLPIVLGDPLHFEGDSGFAHSSEYAQSGPGRKP